jgi:hypothetical protein
MIGPFPAHRERPSPSRSRRRCGSELSTITISEIFATVTLLPPCGQHDHGREHGMDVGSALRNARAGTLSRLSSASPQTVKSGFPPRYTTDSRQQTSGNVSIMLKQRESRLPAFSETSSHPGTTAPRREDYHGDFTATTRVCHLPTGSPSAVDYPVWTVYLVSHSWSSGPLAMLLPRAGRPGAVPALPAMSGILRTMSGGQPRC